MITINVCLRQTDGRMDKHHGNSATIHSNEFIVLKILENKTYKNGSKA